MDQPAKQDESADIDRVRAEQARILFRDCPVGVVAAGTGAILLAVALAAAGRVAPVLAVLWGTMMLGCVAAHLLLCVFYARADPPDRDWRRWLSWFTLIAGIEGVTWLCGATWMTSPTDLTQELVVLLVSSAIASGAVSVFGTYLPTYNAFFFPTILPHLGFALAYDYPLHNLLAALVVAYVVAMSLIARRSNATLVEGLRLRFANLDLVADLQRQKAIVEEASAAKSRFLAAASHDLRQPIHALGLFLGALKARRMDGEAKRLLRQIDGSVAAMDGLFASLLDISRLDAGVVLPEFAAVPLGPLLRRLRDEALEEAAAKGLALMLVPSTAAVTSDPVLLERTLRNLVSNAVRYTDRGGVLIGCRRRGGRVAIEIWDTGIGIDAEHQARIFEEFYQVGNPERDRSQGLGLGLAIVARTAALIGGTLDFTSVPGRGSVFRLVVPSAAGAPAAATPIVPTAAAAHDALIVVVDDEAAIREAMATLLASWGHRTLLGGSADAVIAAHAGGAAPDLLICDYRLRGGETGIDAIRQLHAHFGAAIPAMLVTGDTAPDRIKEAQASGYLLLHKPLPNAKLRAAIGNLLRR